MAKREQLKATVEKLTREVDLLKRKEKQTVILQKEVEVPTFSGGAKQLREFREKCTDAWITSNVTEDTEKVKFVRLHLSDAIKDDLDCYPPGYFDSLDKLWQCLQDAYGDHRSVQQLLSTFNQLQQHATEGVRDFASRLNKSFMELIARQKAEGQRTQDEQVLRDQFITGLRDGLLMRQLRVKVMEGTLSFLEARAFAIQWERHEENMCQVTAQSAVATVAVESHSVLSDLIKIVTQLADRVEALESKKASEKEKERVETDSWQYQYDRKVSADRGNDSEPVQQSDSSDRDNHSNNGQWRQRRCFRCGKPDHIVKHCRRKVRPFVGGSKTRSAQDKNLSDLVGDSPVATMKIGGEAVQALVDTGSQVTMMSEGTFKRLYGTKKVLHNAAMFVKVIAANGMPIPFLGYFEADVEVLGKVVKNKGILVRRDEGLCNPDSRPDVILGMNVLREVGTEIAGLLSTFQVSVGLADMTHDNASPVETACQYATVDREQSRRRQVANVGTSHPQGSVSGYVKEADTTLVSVSLAREQDAGKAIPAMAGNDPKQVGHKRKRRRRRRKRKK